MTDPLLLAAFACLIPAFGVNDPIPMPKFRYDAALLDARGIKGLYQGRDETVVLNPAHKKPHVVVHEMAHHFQRMLMPGMGREERERQAISLQNCLEEKER